MGGDAIEIDGHVRAVGDEGDVLPGVDRRDYPGGFPTRGRAVVGEAVGAEVLVDAGLCGVALPAGDAVDA